jgi:hypothetical protein
LKKRYSNRHCVLALATVQYGISCYSKPEYARYVQHWQIDKPACVEKIVQQRIHREWSVDMDHSIRDPNFTVLYSILQEFSQLMIYRPCIADKNGMVVVHKMKTGLFKVNWDTHGS